MKTFLSIIMTCCALVGIAAPQIINVVARQVKPWPGLVDLSYELTEDVVSPAERGAGTRVVCEDREHGNTYSGFSFTTPPTYEKGVHRLIWDAKTDGVMFSTTNCVFKIEITDRSCYCVIDLSGGTSATSYPVDYLPDVPNSGWTDEYKTSKLVLRYVEPGTFTMGGVYTNIHLTVGFYIGVFEVTQRQWELVMGTRPSYFANNTYYVTRPVEKVSYNMIRGSSLGAQWPASDAVDTTSFLGKLRERTGLNFDLPTEAQWEYACRAGTTTGYNNGTNGSLYSEPDANMAKVGRYCYNGGKEPFVDLSDGDIGYMSPSRYCSTSYGTAPVGSYIPNAWGLYDMHGNVLEWCRDWYGSLSNNRIDPQGESSGSYRVDRGGSWSNYAGDCRSGHRSDANPLSSYSDVGFRLSRTLSK